MAEWEASERRKAAEEVAAMEAQAAAAQQKVRCCCCPAGLLLEGEEGYGRVNRQAGRQYLKQKKRHLRRHVAIQLGSN